MAVISIVEDGDEISTKHTRGPMTFAHPGDVLARPQAVGKARPEYCGASNMLGETLATQLSHRVKALFGLA